MASRSFPVGTGFLVLLTVTAIFVELTTHACAGAFFDPLPDVVAIVAYAFLGAAMVYHVDALARVDRYLSGRTVALLAGEVPPPAPRDVLIPALVSGSAAIGIAVVFAVAFLPTLPIATIAILFMGLGLCAWSPLLNLICLVVQIRHLLDRWHRLRLGSPWRWVAGGTAIALAAALALVGKPFLVGQLVQRAVNEPENRQAIAGQLRFLRAENEVLRLCYSGNGSLYMSAGRSFGGSTEDAAFLGGARRLYYLMTGVPFESRPAPEVRGIFGPMRRAVSIDPEEDQLAGELVGRRNPDLRLLASRFSVEPVPGFAAAETEWELRIANSGAQAEARAEVLLPEGGCVSGAWLRIDGHWRRATIGDRETVRRAYRDVVRRVRREPLLVTMRDPRRVLVQCFPVPQDGEMWVRLQITAPLLDLQLDGCRMALPSIEHANFGANSADCSVRVGGGPAPHTVIDAPGGRPGPVRELRTVEGPVALSGACSDVTIAWGRPAGRPGSWKLISPSALPVSLLILVTPGRSLETGWTPALCSALERALAELPAGSRYCLADQREWEQGQRAGGRLSWHAVTGRPDLSAWWRSRKLDGGYESEAALAWALRTAEAAGHPSAVLWLHGPTPSRILEPALHPQLLEAARGAWLLGLRLGDGPDGLMRVMQSRPRVLALSGRSDRSLSDALEAVAKAEAISNSARTWLPVGGRLPGAGDLYVRPTSTADPATLRLAAFSRAVRAWYAGSSAPEQLAAATRLAVRHGVVTPLTGAVVLETREQYETYGLREGLDEPPGAVPEPSGLLLLGAALAALVVVRCTRCVREASPRGR